MRRICTTLGLIGLLVAALAMPAGASAGHLSRSDFKSASKYCKALRAELGAKAFKKAFRAKRVRGAHRRCVKKDGALPRGVRALAPVSIFPVPAAECPPGTQPEPPLPVRAFATPVVCVPLPPATAPVDGDDDEGDRDDDDGDSDDDDSDDDDSDDDDNGDSDDDNGGSDDD